MKRLFGLLRLVAGLAILTAIIGQFAYSAARTSINPFNFFGYFTIQSNIITMVAFLASAFFILSRKKQPSWVILLRAVATTIIVIVGIVYNTLLSGASLAGSFDLRWSSNILHVIIPIYALVDWVLFADRKKLPYNKLWIVLIYPIVWLVVILIRGATDGWVPYPFLDPATGYGSVALYCIAIAAFTVLFGLAVFALSRVRILKP
ncbi:Pr6Pr family membrane protein [soil metagenome]